MSRRRIHLSPVEDAARPGGAAGAASMARNSLLALMVVTIACAACSTPPGDQPPGLGRMIETGGADAMTDAQWPFWPSNMRIHPLSMISTDRETAQPVIEARVEMLDQFGDTAKCVGQFRFELHAEAPAEDEDDAASRERTTVVRQWNIDVRDPEVNRLHYDRVTRTYLFRLSLEEIAALPEDPYLRVYMLSVTGRRFVDTAALR